MKASEKEERYEKNCAEYQAKQKARNVRFMVKFLLGTILIITIVLIAGVIHNGYLILSLLVIIAFIRTFNIGNSKPKSKGCGGAGNNCQIRKKNGRFG